MEKIEKTYLLLLCILGLYESPYVLSKKSEACFGTGSNMDMFWLSLQCPSSNMIVITEMYYGVKERTTSCNPPINNVSLTDCCVYNQSTDCLVGVFNSKTPETWLKVLEIFGNCTGYDNCYEQATWHRATMCNHVTHYEYSSFMMALYQCIPDSKILQPGDFETSSTDIHVQNSGYPNGTSGNSQIACSFEVPCDSSLELTAIDIQLGSSTGTFDSSHNNLYEHRGINLTDSKRYLVIDIDFAEDSKFWINIKANDSSNLDIACGNKKRTVPLDDCLLTTTEEPTTTKETTLTEKLTSEDTRTGEQTRTEEIKTITNEKTTDQGITVSPILDSTSTMEKTTHMLLNSSSVTPSTLPQVESNDDGEDVGLIVGIVCGVVVGLVIIGAIAFYLSKKKNKKNSVSSSFVPSSTYNKVNEHKNPASETTSDNTTEPLKAQRTGFLGPAPKPLTAGPLPTQIPPRGSELAPLKESRKMILPPQIPPRGSELPHLKENQHRPSNSKMTDIESPDLNYAQVTCSTSCD